MKKQRNIKRIIVGSLLLMVAGFASTASAQDVSKETRDQAVTSDTQEEAQKRAEELGKRLDQDRTKEDDEPKGPEATLEQFQDEQQEMTPEEIAALKKRLREKNREMIGKLDKIIQAQPYSDQKPEWMFQKAELMWELRNWEYLEARAKWNQCNQAAEGGTASDCGEEPEADYSDPQKIYKEILSQYPKYSRLDEVIYRLGSGLIEAGKGVEAIGYLQKLVKNYPNSKYVPDAHLALGEYFFKKEMLGAARDNYQAVLEFENNNNYDFALYKLGWVYYNQGEFRDSINTFKKVVERTDEKLGFQKQALNDLIVAFAEIDQGWKEARAYLNKRGKEQEFVYTKISQMAGLYEAQGKDEMAVDVYTWFIDERPNHKRIPMWMESIIVAKKKINDFDDLEKTMNKYNAYLDPDGTWWKKNKDEEGAINNAKLLVQASLAFLANTYHRRAQDQDVQADYVKATEYYKEFIARFPTNPSSFDMNFFLADIYLLKLEEYAKAAQYYQKVVDLYKNDKVPDGAEEEDVEAMVKDSAYGVVNAYNELVKTNHEDSILVEMALNAERPGDDIQASDSIDDEGQAKPNEKTDLLEYEKGFVEASDQYSNLYPKEEITPTIDFVAGRVYESRGQYDKCIPRYENIIENHGKHRYASFAGNRLIVANYALQRWDEVEEWARYMMKNKIFDVTPKDDLQAAIALAINERAKQLKDNEKFDDATTELLRLAEEFPKSELAPGALYNAAAIYEQGEKVKEAVEVYERVVKEYPKSPQAPDALFVMGAIYESRADFDQAATYFARMASTQEYTNRQGDEVEYKDHENAANAIYNAAVLRGAMEQWEKAIDTFEKYIDLYGDRKEEADNVLTVRLRLGYLEKNKEDWDAAIDRFEDYLELDDAKPAKVVDVHTELGRLLMKTKPRNWEDKADEHFTKAVSKWKELKEDAATEDEAKAARYSAAEARFLQGEVFFRDFNEVELEFPMPTLQKRLVKKGEIQQEAEKIYQEVIGMQNPHWVAAASYRIGQMYRSFGDQLYNLPLPEGLSQEEEDQYRMVLDMDYVTPLQEKALKAFNTALNLALKFEAYNEWSSKSAAAISELDDTTYPITGQEGVDVEHDRTNFFVPEPVTDLRSVVDRVKARKPAEPAPAPTPEGDEAGAEEGETGDAAAADQPETN
ncbi:MAG: tetratricopeptide repeat protein [Myxococcota bacterium]